MSGPASLSGVFFALSDPIRRQIVERVAREPGLTVTAICDGFPVSRFAVMRHLNVLEEAGVLRREAEGRERHVYLGDTGFDRLAVDWLEGLADLKEGTTR
jgi:DNA-binding transcriptional ArsR family regulator